MGNNTSDYKRGPLVPSLCREQEKIKVVKCYMGNPRLTIQEMQEIAKSSGGRCLSRTYERSNIKLKWECSKGHKWCASPNDVKRGTWCPICAGNTKIKIQDMQKIARSRGGRCLSKTYGGTIVKLHWECSEKHKWWASPGHVKNSKSWCPICSKTTRLTIQEMYTIAESRGGRCLSKTYKNAHSKLKWQCAKGHIWETKPAYIRRGHWCPVCAGNRRKTKH
jgi:hypothetical protein